MSPLIWIEQSSESQNVYLPFIAASAVHREEFGGLQQHFLECDKPQGTVSR